MLWLQYERISFGGIQFNTALKHEFDYFQDIIGFGGIQFNTALKLWLPLTQLATGFGGIQFNTALKQQETSILETYSFGGIQFNTALKPRSQFFYCRRLRFLLFVLAKDFRIMNAIVLYFLFILFNFHRTIDKK